MSPEAYRQACDLFDAALEQPSVERRAFLSAACAHDSSLRQQVEHMLEHDREATGLLDHPIVCTTWTPPTGPVAKLVTGTLAAGTLVAGTRLGPYRVTRPLGQGGMGIVYHSVRDDDSFSRQVAIKVVRERPSARAVERFRHERQILAGLEHPYIARLYDGGETADQQPFLVMEYVEGLPITTYCDRHRSTLAERLELMRKVCAAVHFAHRSLIIHCDLKPSNILVNRDGDPKLLDFGIAKLLSSEAAVEGTEGRRDQRVLTPSHASPEQALGKPATTATDIYGVGLVLNELLCGTVPFVDPRLSNYELLRRVCETSPAPPSHTFRPETHSAQPAESPPLEAAEPALDVHDLAHARRATPAQLHRSLRGDLDRITRIALSKAPEDRYASAAQLADELGRHLDNRPLSAGPHAMHYRWAKFCRRHRAPVAVAAVSLALVFCLVNLFIFTLLEQIEDTTREQQKAQRLLGFLTQTFALSHPETALGETVTARELLDQGARRIATELEDEPEVRAMMLNAMGKIYFQIGLLQPAEALLEQGLQQRLALAGEAEPRRDAEITESLTLLGDVQRAAGKLAESEAHLRRAVAHGRQLDDPARLADSLEALATLHRLQYAYGESEAHLREAIELRRRAGDGQRPELARSLAALGTLLREQSDFDEARTSTREALAIRRSLFADTHPDIASSLRDLGELERSLDNLGAAEAAYRQALRIDRELYGDRHQAVIDLKNSLALLLGQQGRLDEATRLLTECVDDLRALAGTHHPDFATMASNLAVMLTRQGAYDRAEVLFREVLETRVQLFGARHPYVGQTHLTWGKLEHQRGDLKAAESHYLLAAGIAENLPLGHRAIAYPKLALAR
ncbi:MAG: serine/threonine-protein kinase, partial [Acidobacteriota bacterium]